MMRALWTGASGMSAQQLNVDTISNNLANVNTTGYKKERLEFKSLLYETMTRATVNAGGAGRPVNLQVGHGVRPLATARLFDMGSLETTNNNSDFAIEGNGFFVIDIGDGEVAYTRDGSFKLGVMEDGDFMLVTSEGYPVLTSEGDTIVIPGNVQIDRVMVDMEGYFSYADENNDIVEMDIRFNIVQFPNRQGLESVGSNLYLETSASGAPLSEQDGEAGRVSRIIQGCLELSNVQLAEEMVKLIVAQRAYEINSKVIQTSDDMLGLANQLKRS